MKGAAIVLGLGLLGGCGAPLAPAGPEPPPRLWAGGAAGTVNIESDGAFSIPAPALRGRDERQFFRGRALFRDQWVTAPASTSTRDGLGPVFNARACVACHLGDGRGRPPEDGEPLREGVVRLSLPGEDAHGAPLPEPAYGLQLQPAGVLGVSAEGRPVIRYQERPGQYQDGTVYSLRIPTLDLEALTLGELAVGTLTSVRVAPMMQGLGLLELVPESVILEAADPDDLDGDGISGRPNWVYDVKKQQRALGRMGWKANQPTIEQQAAGAFAGDLGITSVLFPEGPCTSVNRLCMAAPSGGEPELLDSILADVTFYAQGLAVPAPRRVEDPAVQAGEAQFTALGCASCHRPSLMTGPESQIPGFQQQSFWPYTDLLLHDLGPDLADGRPDFEAGPQEWRTPPLWGLGLLPMVNGHQFLLHDGRARGFAEAILWHGGEAEPAREAFRALDAPARATLITFLESL